MLELHAMARCSVEVCDRQLGIDQSIQFSVVNLQGWKDSAVEAIFPHFGTVKVVDGIDGLSLVTRDSEQVE